jgi:hypothetical protein
MTFELLNHQTIIYFYTQMLIMYVIGVALIFVKFNLGKTFTSETHMQNYQYSLENCLILRCDRINNLGGRIDLSLLCKI